MDKREIFGLIRQHPSEDPEVGVVEGTLTEKDKETQKRIIYENFYIQVSKERGYIVTQHTETADLFYKKQLHI